MSSGLQMSVTVVVLGAAIAHATWNALAHGSKDQLAAFTLLDTGTLLCAVPIAAVVPPPDAASRPYLLASVLIHVGYNLALMRSYAFGDFNQVYPLARGTSPLLVTVLAAVFVGEYPAVPQIIGIAAMAGGMGSLVFAGRRPGPADRTAIAAAVGTGVIIATYTAVDGAGVRLSGGAAGYTAWLMLLHAPFVPLYALARHRRGLFPRLRPALVPGLLAGPLTLLAYGLVLWAQTRGALAPIAALRETSIIFGAIIGTVVFHERFGRARVTATVFVAAGIVLLNLA